MTKRKHLATLLMASALVGSLAACGNSESNGTGIAAGTQSDGSSISDSSADNGGGWRI